MYSSKFWRLESSEFEVVLASDIRSRGVFPGTLLLLLLQVDALDGLVEPDAILRPDLKCIGAWKHSSSSS